MTYDCRCIHTPLSTRLSETRGQGRTGTTATVPESRLLPDPRFHLVAEKSDRPPEPRARQLATPRKLVDGRARQREHRSDFGGRHHVLPRDPARATRLPALVSELRNPVHALSGASATGSCELPDGCPNNSCPLEPALLTPLPLHRRCARRRFRASSRSARTARLASSFSLPSRRPSVSNHTHLAPIRSRPQCPSSSALKFGLRRPVRRPSRHQPAAAPASRQLHATTALGPPQ